MKRKHCFSTFFQGVLFHFLYFSTTFAQQNNTGLKGFIVDPFLHSESEDSIIHSLSKNYQTPYSLEAVHPYALLEGDKKIIFDGQRYALSFKNMALTSQPTSLTAPAILFNNFSYLNFSNCLGDRPLLNAENIAVANNGRVFLSHNVATSNYDHTRTSSGFSLFSSFKKFRLSCNNFVYATYNSAIENSAIASSLEEIFITNNNQIVLESNSSKKRGGCFSAKHISVYGNKRLTAENNCSSLDGGCIYADSSYIRDNGKVSFANNKTASNGGAICARDLEIYDNEDLSFQNNISFSEGGAIFIKEGGSLVLSASTGDILFKLNSSNYGIRNAITTGENLQFCLLQAKQERSILFNDPIVIKGTQATNSQIILNPKNTEFPNTGVIIFSASQTSSSTLEKDLLSRTSLLNGEVLQEDGVVSIKDGAVFSPRQFSQQGGLLLLGAQGTCSSFPLETSHIQLSSLGLNLPSILQSSKESSSNSYAPKLAITKQAGMPDSCSKISISGSIHLTDESLSLYETDITMGSPIQTLDLLSLEPLNSSDIEIANLDLSQPTDHYGFQGSWKLEWSQPSNALHRTLSGSWIPNGLYIPHPERKGEIVANVLNTATVALSEISQAAIGQNLEMFLSSETTRKPWKQNSSITGVASKLHHSSEHSFDSDLHGFSFALSAASAKNNLIGVIASKISQHTEDLRYNQKNNNQLMVGTLFSDISPLSLSFIKIQSLLSYGYGENVLCSQYSNTPLHPEISKFTTHSIQASSTIFFYPYTRLFTPLLSPFISCSFNTSTLTDFKEQASVTRVIETSQCSTSLSLPAGIQIGYPFLFKNRAAIFKGSAAYSPVLYQKDPQLLVRVFSGTPAEAHWNTQGSPLDRYSLECHLSQEMFLSSSIKLSAKYSFVTCPSYFSQSINFGTLAKF